MGVLTSWELIAALGTLSVVCYSYRTRHPSIYPLPPGPRKLPVIGNLWNVPSLYPWKTYAKWGREYDSDVLHLSMAGQSIVVVNSYDAAKELLDRRSITYSSRPHSVMLLELSGFSYQFGLMPYGEPWRVRRRAFKKYLSPPNELIYQAPQAKYISKLLYQLLEHPENFRELVNHTIGSIALSMMYGVDILPHRDPNIDIAELASKAVLESLLAHSQIIDMVPVLRYLPSWFPGASFQKVAARSRGYVKRLRDGLFEDSQRKLSTRALPNPCFVSLCLENCESENDEEQITVCKDVAANTYMAASGSSAAVLMTFILAMVCFPDVQRQAQHELDRVLQGNRLPNRADEALLPYLSAVLKEVLRWRVSIPTGVAHLSTAPDVYKGYYIPENTIMIPNVWAMLNNESDYPEPEKFCPERFLTSEGQLRTDGSVRDPADMLFGFGRRKCPGTHIASSTIWLAAASILAVFDIEKGVDSDGRPIEPNCEFNSGSISEAPPFKCTIKPRSREAMVLIQEINETDVYNDE